jgi:hypothetical protein
MPAQSETPFEGMRIWAPSMPNTWQSESKDNGPLLASTLIHSRTSRNRMSAPASDFHSGNNERRLRALRTI